MLESNMDEETTNFSSLNRRNIKSRNTLRDGSDGKASARDAGDPSSVPELGRSAGEGNGNSLQYSCLENHMDR